MMAYLQAATLAVSQHLTAESGRTLPTEDLLESLQPADPAAMVAYIRPSTPPHAIGGRLQKQKKMKPSPPPPAPIVAQMIEMGFTRNKVEFAVKSLGK